MTRLTTEWLAPIEGSMSAWDGKLAQLTGYTLAGLACRACGLKENIAVGKSAAVVPVTSGEGVIGQFAESVASILRAIGMKAEVTQETDIAGLFEATRKCADLVFMADDNRFIALNLHNGQVGENDHSTALGYRQLLKEMNRRQTGSDLRGEPVLLMGYGRVGHIMYELLQEEGAKVTVFDKDPQRQEELSAEGIPQIPDSSGIEDYRLIVDLTCEGDWLDRQLLKENVIIAAPGVPLSLHPQDMEDLSEQVIHDDLEIGTAVMAVYALS